MNEPISQTRRALGLRAYLNLALAMTVVIFALAGAFTYTQVESRIRADVEEHLDSLATHLARDTIATWLEQKRSLARALAAYPALREMQVEEAQRIIDATYAAAPADYNNIGFFDATGLMVADIAGAAGKGNLMKGNPWGQEVYDGRRTQSPELISSLNNRPIFVLYERVRDASGAVVGVVGVGTDLTAIGDRLEELKIGQTGEAVLVNSQGLVLNRLHHKPDSVLTLDLSQDRLTQLALSGQAGIVEMPDYRGVPVVAAYRPLPEYGWGLVVKQDTDEAFAVLARLRAVFFGVMVGTLAVALVSNLIVQRRVSLALGRLIAGSQRFAAGELATPIEPLAISEFGHLAEEFNRMAIALRRRLAELSALNAMAAIVNESLDVNEILNRALDEALRQVGIEAGGMLLLDEKAGELALVAHRGLSDEFVRAASRIKLGEGLAGRAAQTGQPVVIGNIAEYPGALKAFVEKERIQSGASVPLLGRTGVIGAMSLGTPSPQYLDAAGIELLVALGRQIAIGVEKARLFDAVQRELAERKRAEQRLAAQYAVARCLAESDALADAAPQILQAICESLEWDQGEVWSVLWSPDSKANVLRCVGTWHPPLASFPEFEAVTRQIEFAPGVGLPGRVWASGEPAWIPDVTQDANFPRAPMAAKEGLRAGFAFPLKPDGGVFGVMGFFSREIRQPDDDLLQMFTSLSNQISQFIQRKQAEAALRASEERYRSLFENMLEGFAYCKMLYEDNQPQDFLYLDVNTAFETLTGLKNVIGKKVTDVIPGIRESSPELFEIYGRVALSGQPERFETYLETLGIWFSVSVYSAEKEHFVAVFDNITERKQAEAALRQREQQLSSIYDTVADVIFQLAVEKDGRYRFTSVNRAFLSVTGLDYAQVVSKRVDEIIPEPSLTLVLGKYGEAIREKRIVRWEETSEYPTGRLTGEVSVAPVFDDGNCTHLVGAVHDITERKRAEAALRASEERYRTLAEAAQDMIFVVNREGRLEYVNAFVASRFGLPAEAVVGKRLEALFPLETVALQREDLQQVFDTLQPFYSEDKITFPHGDIWLSTSLAPLKDESGQAYAVMGIARDITGRKQAEEALAAKNEEIKAMSQQLWQAAKLATMGELAASIAHELNNPLATVSLRAESLSAQIPPGDPMHRELKVIEQEVDRMGTLVANLLQFSRRGSQQISTLDVREEIDRTLELIHYHLRQRQVAVVRDFAPNALFIQADRQQLRQLFLNLFTNAADAMPEGGTLTLRVSAVENQVLIEIMDTGVGIAPEDLPKVAEPFFTTKPEGKGTGLGLAICRRVVQEHDGTLAIASAGPGQGATARVTLPIQNETNGQALTAA